MAAGSSSAPGACRPWGWSRATSGPVDEYRLLVFPVVLGSGARMFPDDAEHKTPLELVDTKVFRSGVAVHTYRAARGL